MRIANNVAALSAFNTLAKTSNSMQKTLQSLSSGLRINSAADDAAGLAISEKMRSQISGLDVAVKNTQDGVSLLQTAEGALESTNGILQRMRELSVQAANDVLTQQDRRYIQTEIDQLKDEIDRIADTTQFNKKKILNGSVGALWSSSNPEVKARINGSITDIDQFGQKVSSEGNYDLEITAKHGRGQVQKSAIFNVKYDKETAEYFMKGYEERTITKAVTSTTAITDTTTEESEVWININNGIDTFGRTSGAGWRVDNTNYGKSLTITKNGNYQIYGSVTADGTPIKTNNYITIAAGVTANVRLRDVNVEASLYAFDTRNATTNIYLDPGDYDNPNTFVSTGRYGHTSAIMAPAGSTITITSINGDFDTTGTLNATGSLHGAGIGGACSGGVDAGNITIWGGTINATGGYGAAGIGGGWHGKAGNITINGGIINATSIEGGAGIGSGGNNDYSYSSTYATGSSITIRGGTINATGGPEYQYSDTENRVYSSIGAGAGIGGGGGFYAGAIKIDPGVSVTAAGGNSDAEAIGAGQLRYGVAPTINPYQDLSLPAARPPFEPDLEEIVTTETEYGTETTYVTETQIIETSIAQMQTFYKQDGTFLLEDPQKLTITQGDGKSADVMLYSYDTMYDVASKINDAIATDLGQAKYTDNGTNFCTIADGTETTSESIYQEIPVYDDDGEIVGYKYDATMLVRSVKPGKEGELTFSGNEDLLNILGFNTIQESTESEYTIDVRNAHTGETLETGRKVTGHVAHGLIHRNVDVEFDAMAGIEARWDDDRKLYVHENIGKYRTTLHLADNSMKLQTGANEGEDFIVNIGDMSSDALGVDRVNVSSHETASRAITIIDAAIDKVVTQRARIGSSENALEHTMNSLITASENMTSAESRIRDTDMAKTMMNFTKLQIMTQSGISMLSQANQLPQQVLSLIR